MNKKLASWVNILDHSDFSIYNQPFGIFSVENNKSVIDISTIFFKVIENA